jgi:outer membrane protein TolC
MRVSKFVAALGCVLGSALFAGSARAQVAADTSSGPTLTLEQAVQLALRNNPEYQQIVDQRSPAAARVRAAYGAFVPGANVSLSGGYLQQGNINVSGVPGLTTGSDQVQSSYQLGLTYRLTVGTFVAPSQSSASLRATDFDISSAAALLRSDVANSYLLVLVDEANSALQDSLILSNQIQVDLARAKLSAGSGTVLDLSKAQVGLGNQRIAAIRAKNQVQVDRLSLFQLIGSPQPQDVRLTTRIPVTPPTFSLDSVLGLARASNPALQALESRAVAADKGVTTAKGTFLPTLNAFAGWGGYANQYTNSNYPVSSATAQYNAGLSQCATTDSIRLGAGMPGLNCGALYVPPDTAAILKRNNAVPWNFTKSPFQASVTLSLPILDGLSRLSQVEDAKALSNDARYRVRSQELRLTADVTSAYLTLVAATEAVQLSRDNQAQALLALNLAQEKYRVGSATAVELSDQRDQYQRAVSQLLTSTFDYHRAFAALERAVGRPLR